MSNSVLTLLSVKIYAESRTWLLLVSGAREKESIQPSDCRRRREYENDVPLRCPKRETFNCFATELKTVYDTVGESIDVIGSRPPKA